MAFRRVRVLPLPAFFVLLTAFPLAVDARPHYPKPFVEQQALDALQRRVRAKGAPIETGCRTPDGSQCKQTALARVQSKLAGLSDDGGVVRVLHLGDSHIAADYITSRIRWDWQRRYGDGGRGFVHPDQRWGYGGRRVAKSKRGWRRGRVVDGGRSVGKRYGFSGNRLTARRKKVSLWYRVRPSDQVVRVFHAPSRRGSISVWLDSKYIGRFRLKSGLIEIPLPERSARRFRSGPPGNSLRLRANRKGITLYGLSFERRGPGVQYSSIGPVGADAKVYLQLEQRSFARSLRLYEPDLVVYMVGGNDALKIRKGWTSLSRVTRDHRRLLRAVRSAVPTADCLLWAPMLAGRRVKRGVVSKRYLTEVRDMQRRVAKEEGCAFWDTMSAMGGPRNIRRWASAMNKDLVHPGKAAADLLGRMFARAWAKLD